MSSNNYVNASFNAKLYDDGLSKIQEIVSEEIQKMATDRDAYKTKLETDIATLTGNTDLDTWLAEKTDKKTLTPDEMQLYTELKAKYDILYNKNDFNYSSDISDGLQNSAKFFEIKAWLSHIEQDPDTWKYLNGLDPTDKDSVELLKLISEYAQDTREKKDWYSGSTAEDKNARTVIENFEKLQSEVITTILDPSVDPLTKTAVGIKWKQYTNEIDYAQNEQISPEDKNSKGIEAMKNTKTDIKEFLALSPEQQRERFAEDYKKSFEAEMIHLENGIKSGAFDEEWTARAKNTLTEMQKTGAVLGTDVTVNKILEMHNNGTDPLSQIQDANGTLYYVSDKFKEQQLYENQKQLMKPHYLEDVPDLKRDIEEGKYSGISQDPIKESLRQLKEHFTIIIAPHNVQQAGRVADRVAFMLMGSLVEYGLTSEVFANPKDKRTSDYITGRFG